MTAPRGQRQLQRRAAADPGHSAGRLAQPPTRLRRRRPAKKSSRRAGCRARRRPPATAPVQQCAGARDIGTHGGVLHDATAAEVTV
eukprot:366449-Chlamydomonas_euryale.AAC.6